MTQKIKKTKTPRSLRKIAAIGLLSTLALTGCTTISTNPDEIGLWYKAGPFTATQFDHCVNPGTLERWKGVADKTYSYPAGLRTYNFSNTQPGAESPAFDAPTKEPVYLTIEGYITYTLTNNCEDLQRFHETIGLKYTAWNDGEEGEPGSTSKGWNDMLNQYLGTALKDALTKATGEYGWKEIYDNPKVTEAWKKRVTEFLPSGVKSAMGGDYFENFTITIQKPILPDNLRNASQEREVAKTQTDAQRAKNETVREELNVIRDVVKVVGKENYALLEAVKSGKVTVVGIPTGSGLTLPAESK